MLKFGPASLDAIEKREAQCGKRFPSDYKQFLEEFAGGMLLGYEVFGVPTKKSVVSGGDLSTLSEEDLIRRSVITDVGAANAVRGAYGGRPQLQFSHDQGDYDFVFDLESVDTFGIAPVCLWGPGSEGLVVAHGFLDFFRKIANREDVFDVLK